MAHFLFPLVFTTFMQLKDSGKDRLSFLRATVGLHWLCIRGLDSSTLGTFLKLSFGSICLSELLCLSVLSWAPSSWVLRS